MIVVQYGSHESDTRRDSHAIVLGMRLRMELTHQTLVLLSHVRHLLHERERSEMGKIVRPIDALEGVRGETTQACKSFTDNVRTSQEVKDVERQKRNELCPSRKQQSRLKQYVAFSVEHELCNPRTPQRTQREQDKVGNYQQGHETIRGPPEDLLRPGWEMELPGWKIMPR